MNPAASSSYELVGGLLFHHVICYLLTLSILAQILTLIKVIHIFSVFLKDSFKKYIHSYSTFIKPKKINTKLLFE